MNVTNIETFVNALLARQGRLFHFTDSQNIANIRQFGLLPTAQLASNGIVAVTGGDAASLAIDQAKGFDNYVRLSFCRKHPMSHVAMERGGITELRILRICPSVLLRQGAKIADRVATANDAKIANANDIIHEMDFKATYTWIDWSVPENRARRNAAEKWEALIPGAIAPNLILDL